MVQDALCIITYDRVSQGRQCVLPGARSRELAVDELPMLIRVPTSPSIKESAQPDRAAEAELIISHKGDMFDRAHIPAWSAGGGEEIN